MRGRAALALLGVAVLAGGCAKRVVPVVPEGEDYVFPAPAPGEASPEEARELRSAWTAVLAGDSAEAARRYERLLARHPGLAPARTGLAYARMRAGRLDAARAAFAEALEAQPADVSALVGAGSVAFRSGDLDGAVGFLRRALAAAPDDPLVRKRLAALRLQATDRRMALATAALERGDTAAAAQEYAAALEAAPEVAPVRLALAELLVGGGDAAGAVALLEADPSAERPLALRRAELLTGLAEFERAAQVYQELLARDPGDAEARAGERAAREAQELAEMPEPYRAIPEAARITRADLAALVAVRVRGLRRAGPGEAKVAVDISGSWARAQIARVLALGIMDVYPNHTFQPGAIVRRVDLARAAARTLDRLGWPRGAGPIPTDMSRSHLDYAAVERAVGAGLMPLTASGAFEPWRPVSGPEALAVVDSLAHLPGSNEPRR